MILTIEKTLVGTLEAYHIRMALRLILWTEDREPVSQTYKVLMETV